MTRAAFCKGCQSDFAAPNERGRLPHFCPECKTNPEVVTQTTNTQQRERQAAQKLSVEAYLDDLENRLKASGLHISQHRKDD